MLYATKAILIPANTATITVNVIDAVIYIGSNSISVAMCVSAISNVRK